MALQWGHDLSVVESRPSGTARSRSRSSFNGATTSRSWNLTHGADEPTGGSGASMGPRPLGRGIAGDRARLVEGGPASMGPRPLGRGIPHPDRQPADARHASMGPRPLGRGIDPEAVKRAARQIVASMGPRPLGRGIPAKTERPIAASPGASMGPRPLGRGIFAGSGNTLKYRLQLQWGHDLSVVESGHRPVARRPVTCFNGATTSRSWNRAGAFRGTGQQCASMGPRPLGRGIPGEAARRDRPAEASMGPRPLGRGISRQPSSRGAAGFGFNGATTSRSWNRGPARGPR